MKFALKFILAIVLLFNWACQYDVKEFKAINQEVDFKYIQFGEGERPEIGQFLSTSFVVSNEAGDTLHYVPNYPYVFQLKEAAFDSAFTTIQVGDSGVFRLKRSDFNQKFSFYQPLQKDTGLVYVYFRLNHILEKGEVEDYKRKVLSERELKEQLALRKYVKSLEGYLDTIQDVYRLIAEINHEGDDIKSGSEVSITYQGKFLNGYVFEDSRNKSIVPTFTYGQEYQLIDGLHLGLSGLKSGESVKIILPSRRAFGEEGSLAGIVPPYTAVIFDVKIIKVKN